MLSVTNRVSPVTPSKVKNRRLPAALRAAIEPLESRTMLTSVVVNSLSDTATGTGVVTLRDAGSVADSSTSSTTITFSTPVFASAKTITLNGHDLELSNTAHPTTIAGPAAGVTLNGNGRVGGFQIDQGVTATISHVNITNDAAVGDNLGCGVYNDGKLTLSSSTISNNTGAHGKYGGGLYNDVDGVATLSSVTISGNTSGSNDGGGIWNAGTMTLTDATVSDNSVGGAQGGGIYNNGPATFTNVTISGNTEKVNGSAGGGVFNNSEAVFVNVTISGNVVTANPLASGGGLFNNLNATATFTNCTIADNSVTGPNATCGGINNNGGTLTLSDDTVSGNSASTSSGGVFSGTYAGVDHPLTIENTIVAGNSSPTSPDVDGPFHSLGHNLIGKTNGSTGWLSTDLKGTVASPLNAQLGALANNGGFTETLLPSASSPAIGAGSVALIPKGITTDQRGDARTVSGKVDIGAVEVQPAHAAPTAVIASAPVGVFGDTGVALGADDPSAPVISVRVRDTFGGR